MYSHYSTSTISNVDKDVTLVFCSTLKSLNIHKCGLYNVVNTRESRPSFNHTHDKIKSETYFWAGFFCVVSDSGSAFTHSHIRPWNVTQSTWLPFFTTTLFVFFIALQFVTYKLQIATVHFSVYFKSKPYIFDVCSMYYRTWWHLIQNQFSD